MLGDSDSSIIRRAIISIVVLGLVSQASIAPAFAAVSTTTTSQDDPCSEVFEVFGVELNPVGKAVECREQRKAEKLVSNVTHTDLYASGLAQSDLGRSGRTPILNHLNDSRTYVRTEVKTEAIELFNNDSNGLTKSQIKAELNNTVESYYTAMQKNLLSTSSSNVNQAWYMLQARQDTTLNQSILISAGVELASDGTYQDHYIGKSFPNGEDYIEEGWHNESNYKWFINNQTVNFLDGSNRSSVPYITYKRIDTDTVQGTLDPTNTTAKYGAAPIAFWIYVEEPGTNGGDHVEAYDGRQYMRSWERIKTTNSQMKNEASQFVDLLYNNYNRSGGVDVTEVLNPNDIVSQWNTNYNSTGYYGWIAATLGLTGLEGDINSSFAINYTPRVNHTDNGNYTLNGSGQHDYAYVSGDTYNVSGTLMTDWDPNPNQTYAFQRGATYDTANTTAPVLFIEQVNSTESRVVRLNGTFTIDTLTNVQTGETINSTSLEEQNQQTWNTTSSIEEIRDLVEYRDKAVTSNQAGGGGINTGGLFGNFNFGTTGLILIALAGGALLILTRS